MIGGALGLFALVFWLGMLIVTILVIYWLWVIQDRTVKLAADVAEIRSLLQASGNRGGTGQSAPNPAGGSPASGEPGG